MSNAPIQVTNVSPLPGAQLVNEINSALMAVASYFSGTADPAPNAGPFMRWADTGTGRWRMRNSANTEWIDIGPLSAEATEPIDGALMASQAWAEKKLQGRLPVFPSDHVPTADVGPILVPGGGFMTWNGNVYVPNNLPPRHRSGGRLSIGSTSVSIAPAMLRASDNSQDLVLTTAWTKNLQSAGSWTAGSNQNGLFSGARAATTWYHVYLIQNDATGAIDAGFSTSYPPTDLPPGWSKWRRLGSVYMMFTALLTYAQVGNRFIWHNVRPTVNNATVSNAQLLNMDVPAGLPVEGLFTFLINSTSNNTFLLCTPGTSDDVAPLFGDLRVNATVQNTVQVVTNASRQIQCYMTTVSQSVVNIGTKGWTDFLED